MSLGSFLGVRVVVHPILLLLVVVLGWAGFLVETITVFLVVFLHEMAHGIVAKRSGLEVEEVELLPFGGVARIDGLVEIEPDVEIVVALAGPLTNLLLIGVAAAEARVELAPEEWRSFFVQANAVIGGFNLLPALPLDGGRVFRALLSRTLGFRKATDLAAQAGKAFAILLGLAGAVGLYLGRIGPSPLAVAAFLFFAARKEQALAAYFFLRYLARKQSELGRRHCLVSRHLAALAHAPLKEVMRHFAPHRYHIVWAIDATGSVIGCVSEHDLIETFLTRGGDSTVAEALRGRS